MAPTFRSGHTAFFSMTDSAAATINYSSGLDDASLARIAQALKVTTFGDADEVYVPGLKDATLKLSGLFASTYEEKLSASIGHSTVLQWIYGPESTANTRRKLSGGGIITAFSIGSPVGDKVSMSFDVQCSGVITSSTF